LIGEFAYWTIISVCLCVSVCVSVSLSLSPILSLSLSVSRFSSPSFRPPVRPTLGQRDLGKENPSSAQCVFGWGLVGEIAYWMMNSNEPLISTPKQAVSHESKRNDRQIHITDVRPSIFATLP